MPERPGEGSPDSRRPPDRGRYDGRSNGSSGSGTRGRRPGTSGPGRGRAPRGSGKPDQVRRRGGGPIGLARLGGEDFELVHPRAAGETDLDYQEGLELWKAGDPEGARDALRYALSACHDNLWIHVALGRIALREFRDPALAQGHFGYAFELGRRALPHGFSGRLPPDRPANRPFYEAIEGLLQCLDALGRGPESQDLRAVRDRLAGGSSQEEAAQRIG